MKIIKIFKNYRESTDIMLLVLFVGNIILLADILSSSFTKDFVVSIMEKSSKLPVLKGENYTLENREVYSEINFRSEKFLDHLFVSKEAGPNPVFFLFTLIVIFQLMRIKSLWYHQYFTNKLYSAIDALSFIALLMFLFCQIQRIYVDKLVEKISKEAFSAEIDSYFLIFSVVVIILSSVLKSFAKRGNKLQEDLDLTI